VLGEELKKRILRCVDKALDTFGESFRQVVYYYVGQNYGLKQQDIVDRPQDFVEALRNIFGAGADVIERVLAENIKSEFNIDIVEWSFAQAVEEARRYSQSCDQ